MIVLAAIVLFIALLVTLTLLLGGFSERLYRAGREKGFNQGFVLGLEEGREEERQRALKRNYFTVRVKGPIVVPGDARRAPAALTQ